MTEQTSQSTNERNAEPIVYEFLNKLPNVSEAQDAHLRSMIEQTIGKLNKGHQDITDAAIALEPEAQNGSVFWFRARVVVYIRPENIAGVAQDETAEKALRGALQAVERQVRERRDKLREPYKQP